MRYWCGKIFDRRIARYRRTIGVIEPLVRAELLSVPVAVGSARARAVNRG